VHINGIFLVVAAVLLLESQPIVVAQETPNIVAKQQRLNGITELRQRDEVALKTKIHPDIRRKLAIGENVLVIVHLDVPLPQRKTPDRSDDFYSKALIASAQEHVLSALSLRQFKVMRRYDNFPLIALEIGQDALDILDASPLVLRVQESRMNRPGLNQSVPMIGGPQVWAPPTNINGSGWTVAIIDSGVSHSHPFLQDNNTTIVVTDEACYSVTQDCPGGVSSLIAQNAAAPCTFAQSGGCRHGTQVAGIVASRDSTYKGVAPGANILAVNAASHATGTACNGDPYNDNPCVRYNDLDIIAGLDWIYTMRNTYSIAAVNISIQGTFFADQQSCDFIVL
jgi:hypothetical protein